MGSKGKLALKRAVAETDFVHLIMDKSTLEKFVSTYDALAGQLKTGDRLFVETGRNERRGGKFGGYPEFRIVLLEGQGKGAKPEIKTLVRGQGHSFSGYHQYTQEHKLYPILK